MHQPAAHWPPLAPAPLLAARRFFATIPASCSISRSQLYET